MARTCPKGGANLSDSSSATDGTGSSTTTSTRRCASGGGRGVDVTWSLDDEDSVPLLYDLRPLSELINPITFPDLKTNGQVFAMVRARQAIDQAINARVNGVGSFSTAALRADTRPQVWRVNFRDMVCADSGDMAGGVGKIQLLGAVAAEFTDMRGKTTVDLFGTKFTEKQGEDAYKFDSVDCGPSAVPFPINKKATFLINPTDPQQGSIFVNMEKLFKYVELPDRAGQQAAATAIKVASGGWWISAKIIDAIAGKDLFVKGGLADSMHTGIDGLKEDFLARSVQLNNMSVSRRFVSDTQSIGFYNLQGWPIGVMSNQPRLLIRYETQRVE